MDAEREESTNNIWKTYKESMFCLKPLLEKSAAYITENSNNRLGISRFNSTETKNTT